MNGNRKAFLDMRAGSRKLKPGATYTTILVGLR